MIGELARAMSGKSTKIMKIGGAARAAGARGCLMMGVAQARWCGTRIGG